LRSIFGEGAVTMRVLAIPAEICACFGSVQAKHQPDFFPQLEHSDDVGPVVFSAELGIFVSGSNDKTIKLDKASRRCLERQVDTHERRLETGMRRFELCNL
jgi:hypothetical protein